ncbi:DUF1007 family protein [Loktanella sp. IMCC34160]|uniref:DUF1007 family protein n=1 Tax=Loktanella sp. IMCC34160 TaxID=2510646 RepID=UPI00101B99D0|nr:DUF1007 family protein [Loktanella sp. IMCC34160]RYG93031.1 DUF1007 family protein [Loktanella sp. IMCC34160]
MKPQLIAATLALATLAAPLRAHPHVFIDTSVTVVFDDAGRVAGVRLVWLYDDFFSLLLTEDMGLDPDGDMVLTEAELQELSDFVLDWPEGFAGDLTLEHGGVALPLGPRQAAQVRLVDGRMEESHYRPLQTPVAASDAPLIVAPYDPYYYTAHIVDEVIGLEGGAGCAARLHPADIAAAQTQAEQILFGRSIDQFGPEENLPEVGHLFADRVEVTCAP